MHVLRLFVFGAAILAAGCGDCKKRECKVVKTCGCVCANCDPTKSPCPCRPCPDCTCCDSNCCER
jgi:hypothetical protein